MLAPPPLGFMRIGNTDCSSCFSSSFPPPSMNVALWSYFGPLLFQTRAPIVEIPSLLGFVIIAITVSPLSGVTALVKKGGSICTIEAWGTVWCLAK